MIGRLNQRLNHKTPFVRIFPTHFSYNRDQPLHFFAVGHKTRNCLSIIMGNEKKNKAEEMAEKGVKGTEKGLKKGWDKAKGFGKKVEEGIEGEEKKEEK